MADKRLADIRREYSLKELTRRSVDQDPFAQFGVWMDEAISAELQEGTAMTLSTNGLDGIPSSRVVLLKGFDMAGFVFYTNYESRKGQEIDADPRASVNFFWPHLERQINIRGSIVRTSREESEAYFATRPFDSRIGAIASHQSSTLASRQELESRFEELNKIYAGKDVPTPENWGGYRLTPMQFEFWQGRPSRLHDRICYRLIGDEWQISRLAP